MSDSSSSVHVYKVGDRVTVSAHGPTEEEFNAVVTRIDPSSATARYIVVVEKGGKQTYQIDPSDMRPGHHAQIMPARAAAPAVAPARQPRRRPRYSTLTTTTVTPAPLTPTRSTRGSSTARVPFTVGAGSRRNLFERLPPRGELLQAQYATLVAFHNMRLTDKVISSHWSRLIYSPWIVPAGSLLLVPLRVREGESTISSSLLGVFSVEGVDLVQTAAQARALLHYSGLIMTEDLLNMFEDRFFCPTGVDAGTLDYSVKAEEKFWANRTMPSAPTQSEITSKTFTHIVIVADPRQSSALINDGPMSGISPNCTLHCLARDAHGYRESVRLLPGDPTITVSHDIAMIYQLPGTYIHQHSELTLSYGPGFWVGNDDPRIHCAQCFHRQFPQRDRFDVDWNEPNPFILCAVADCRHARHLLCFPDGLRVSPLDYYRGSIRFYCPDHLAEPRQNVARPALVPEYNEALAEEYTGVSRSEGDGSDEEYRGHSRSNKRKVATRRTLRSTRAGPAETESDPFDDSDLWRPLPLPSPSPSPAAAAAHDPEGSPRPTEQSGLTPSALDQLATAKIAQGPPHTTVGDYSDQILALADPAVYGYCYRPSWYREQTGDIRSALDHLSALALSIEFDCLYDPISLSNQWNIPLDNAHLQSVLPAVVQTIESVLGFTGSAEPIAASLLVTAPIRSHRSSLIHMDKSDGWNTGHSRFTVLITLTPDAEPHSTVYLPKFSLAQLPSDVVIPDPRVSHGMLQSPIQREMVRASADFLFDPSNYHCSNAAKLGALVAFDQRVPHYANNTSKNTARRELVLEFGPAAAPASPTDSSSLPVAPPSRTDRSTVPVYEWDVRRWGHGDHSEEFAVALHKHRWYDPLSRMKSEPEEQIALYLACLHKFSLFHEFLLALPPPGQKFYDALFQSHQPADPSSQSAALQSNDDRAAARIARGPIANTLTPVAAAQYATDSIRCAEQYGYMSFQWIKPDQPKRLESIEILAKLPVTKWANITAEKISGGTIQYDLKLLSSSTEQSLARGILVSIEGAVARAIRQVFQNNPYVEKHLTCTAWKLLESDNTTEQSIHADDLDGFNVPPSSRKYSAIVALSDTKYFSTHLPLFDLAQYPSPIDFDQLHSDPTNPQHQMMRAIYPHLFNKQNYWTQQVSAGWLTLFQQCVFHYGPGHRSDTPRRVLFLEFTTEEDPPVRPADYIEQQMFEWAIVEFLFGFDSRQYALTLCKYAEGGDPPLTRFEKEYLPKALQVLDHHKLYQRYCATIDRKTRLQYDKILKRAKQDSKTNENDDNDPPAPGDDDLSPFPGGDDPPAGGSAPPAGAAPGPAPASKESQSNDEIQSQKSRPLSTPAVKVRKTAAGDDVATVRSKQSSTKPSRSAAQVLWDSELTSLLSVRTESHAFRSFRYAQRLLQSAEAGAGLTPAVHPLASFPTDRLAAAIWVLMRSGNMFEQYSQRIDSATLRRYGDLARRMLEEQEVQSAAVAAPAEGESSRTGVRSALPGGLFTVRPATPALPADLRISMNSPQFRTVEYADLLVGYSSRSEDHPLHHWSGERLREAINVLRSHGRWGTYCEVHGSNIDEEEMEDYDRIWADIQRVNAEEAAQRRAELLAQEAKDAAARDNPPGPGPPGPPPQPPPSGGTGGGTGTAKDQPPAGAPPEQSQQQEQQQPPDQPNEPAPMVDSAADVIPDSRVSRTPSVSVPVPVPVAPVQQPRVPVEFTGRRFVLDYPQKVADPLPPLLIKLGAIIITQLLNSKDELVVESLHKSHISTALQQSTHSRYGRLIASGPLVAAASVMMEDRWGQAERMNCPVRLRAKLLLDARRREEEEHNLVPCLIISDKAGLFKPDITYFPTIRVDAAGPGGASTWVHTAPSIDWDAPPGRSPFVSGLQRTEDLARAQRDKDERDQMAAAVKHKHVPSSSLNLLIARQESKATAALPPPPAPKLLWCEICRRHCTSEQQHHNTLDHQKQFDHYERQRKPLYDEVEMQELWEDKCARMERIIARYKRTGRIQTDSDSDQSSHHGHSSQPLNTSVPAAAVSDEASSSPPPLPPPFPHPTVSVRVLESSGANNQCFFVTVARALDSPAHLRSAQCSIDSEECRHSATHSPVPLTGDTPPLHFPFLEELIITALDECPLSLLQLYGVGESDCVWRKKNQLRSGGTPAEREKLAELIRQGYRADPVCSEQTLGGQPELYLLSHALDQRVAFRVATINADHHSSSVMQQWALVVSAPPDYPADSDDVILWTDDPLTLARIEREVTLFQCSYTGGTSLNHYEQIVYTLTQNDCRTAAAAPHAQPIIRNHWVCTRDQSPWDAYLPPGQSRESLVYEACRTAQQVTRKRVAEMRAENEAAALKLAGPRGEPKGLTDRGTPSQRGRGQGRGRPTVTCASRQLCTADKLQTVTRPTSPARGSISSNVTRSTPMAKGRGAAAGQAQRTLKRTGLGSSSSSANWFGLYARGVPVVHPLLHSSPTSTAPFAALSAAASESNSDSHSGSIRLELRVQREVSTRHLDRPVQIGLYVRADAAAADGDRSTPPVVFEEGQTVCDYGGLIGTDTDYRAVSSAAPPPLPATHVRAIAGIPFVLDGLPLAAMIRRPVPGTAEGLDEIITHGVFPLLPTSTTDGPFTAAQVRQFHARALGCMANNSITGCNVRSGTRKIRVGGISYEVPTLVATQRILQGDEILAPYNTEESRRSPDWIDLQPSGGQSDESDDPQQSHQPDSEASPPPPLRPSRSRSGRLAQLDHLQGQGSTTKESSAREDPSITNDRAGAFDDECEWGGDGDIDFDQPQDHLIHSSPCPTPSHVVHSDDCSASGDESSIESDHSLYLSESHTDSLMPSDQDSSESESDSPLSECRAPSGPSSLSLFPSLAQGHTGFESPHRPGPALQLARRGMVVREEKDTRLLPNFLSNLIELNAHGVDRMNKLLTTVALMYADAHWSFKRFRPPKRKKKHTPLTAPRSAQSIRPLTQHSDSEGQEEEGAGADELVPRSAPASAVSLPLPRASTPPESDPDGHPALLPIRRGTGPNSPRWYRIENIEYDWAELSACCGSDSAILLILPNIFDMFHKRLKDRGICRTSSAFTDKIREALVNATAPRSTSHTDSVSPSRGPSAGCRSSLPSESDRCVMWEGKRYCFSCFRAYHGIGRTTMFDLLRNLNAHEQAENPHVNRDCTPRRPRPAPIRDYFSELLLEFAGTQGQSAPNPRAEDEQVKEKVLWLPQKSWNELAVAIGHFRQERENLPTADLPTIHSLQAARNFLKDHRDTTIRLGSCSTMLRCNHCDFMDNQREREKCPQMKKQWTIKKHAHLRDMSDQRAEFESLKKRAMANPTDLWVITLDGMDQAKTQLPSRMRYSKDLDPLDRMKVHVIGGFCFGGPVPVMGLLNYPDLRKDGSLSVTTLDHMINLQFRKLQADKDKKDKREQEAAEKLRKAAAEKLAAAAGPAPDTDGSSSSVYIEGGAAAAAAVGAGAPKYSGVGLQWPKRLHVTFDNAKGECKNQFMFRYLGVLVMNSVFEHITVSNLLVGHTHDIVDQMFSVWARVLRFNNAETYEKMRKLFHEKYTTRIQGLIDLMRGNQEARDTLSEEEKENLDDMKNNEEEMQDAVNALVNHADLLNSLNIERGNKEESDLAPHIELQTASAEIKGWLLRSVIAKGAKHTPLSFIEKAHNFLIKKDPIDNHVYLYSKYLTRSADQPTSIQFDTEQNMMVTVTHRYTGGVVGVGMGNWTSRVRLINAAHAVPMADIPDPYRLPPLKVDIAKLKKTVKEYKACRAMSDEDAAEFMSMLAGLQQDQDDQLLKCARCSELQSAVTAIGVVSKSVKLSEQAQKDAEGKVKERNTAWDALEAHMQDGAYDDIHSSTMRFDGFWSKWTNRVREHFEPARISLGRIADPAALHLRHIIHPTSLPTDRHEPVIRVRPIVPVRVDLRWLNVHGLPMEGQFAIVRSDSLTEPLWVGKIIKVNSTRPVLVRGDAIAAAAAAPPVSPDPRGGETHLKSLRALELEVQYFDLSPEDFTQMHLPVQKEDKSVTQKNNDWWAQQYIHSGTCPPCAESDGQVTSPAYAAERLAEMQETFSESRGSPSRGSRGDPPRVPSWIVNMYYKRKYIPQTRPELFSVTGQSLVAWGPESELFTKVPASLTHTIRRGVFAHAWSDLTGHAIEDFQPNAHADAYAQRESNPKTKEKRKRRKRAAANDPAGPPAKKARVVAAATMSATATCSGLPRIRRAAAILSGERTRLSTQQDEQGSESDSDIQSDATAAAVDSQSESDHDESDCGDDPDSEESDSDCHSEEPDTENQPPTDHPIIPVRVGQSPISTTGTHPVTVSHSATVSRSAAAEAANKPNSSEPRRSSAVRRKAAASPDDESAENRPLAHLISNKRKTIAAAAATDADENRPLSYLKQPGTRAAAPRGATVTRRALADISNQRK